MPKKSMTTQGENQQLCLFYFPAGSRALPKTKAKVKVKHKRPDAVYTYQLAADIPTVPVDRVPTHLAAKLLRKNARSFRRGVSFRAEGFHGQTLLFIWAGTNPDDRREYLWDIHVELAS